MWSAYNRQQQELPSDDNSLSEGEYNANESREQWLQSFQ